MSSNSLWDGGLLYAGRFDAYDVKARTERDGKNDMSILPVSLCIVPRVGRPLYGYKCKNAAAFFPQIFSTIFPSACSSAGYWPLSTNSPRRLQRMRR